jgi:hypothetical protein
MTPILELVCIRKPAGMVDGWSGVDHCPPASRAASYPTS